MLGNDGQTKLDRAKTAFRLIVGQKLLFGYKQVDAALSVISGLCLSVCHK